MALDSKTTQEELANTAIDLTRDHFVAVAEVDMGASTDQVAGLFGGQFEIELKDLLQCLEPLWIARVASPASTTRTTW